MIAPEQMDRFGDLPLTVESEVGRCLLPVGDVLALTAGSVLKLSTPAGSGVQLVIGGVAFASGEVIRTGAAPAVRLLSFGKASRKKSV